MRNWKKLALTGSDEFRGKECLDLEGVRDLFHSKAVGVLFHSNSHANGSFEWLAAFGKSEIFEATNDQEPFLEFQNFLAKHKDWVFGHFSYDLKNSIEQLRSEHFSGIDFPNLSFFIPEVIGIKTKDFFSYSASNENDEMELLSGLQLSGLQTRQYEVAQQHEGSGIILRTRTSKESYIHHVNSILKHIYRGDIYEMNYCLEFFAENVSVDPIAIFERLNELTEAPFSVLYKNDEQWLICASPERFIQKKGNKISSQPIKGTRPRGKTSEEDDQLKEELFLDPKERSENVMIVDLVRNDLSKSAKKGSVKVEELFGIHTFKNVHQMISTVSCELNENVNPVEAIRNAFPMGSMTGAPKIRAMELIEEFENMKRGLYSGAVGYFTPEMDFDFNVVIRSIQYNSKTGYLSLMVGSAITANSDPEKEYEECLVKAETLFQALGVGVDFLPQRQQDTKHFGG